MFYCYIVRCADGTLYTGVTSNLARRLEEHNAGKGARYTARRRPVSMVWNGAFPNRSQAQRREAEIKRWRREKKESLIEASRATTGKSTGMLDF